MASEKDKFIEEAVSQGLDPEDAELLWSDLGSVPKGRESLVELDDDDRAILSGEMVIPSEPVKPVSAGLPETRSGPPPEPDWNVKRAEFEARAAEFQAAREDDLRRLHNLSPDAPLPEHLFNQAVEDTMRWRWVSGDPPSGEPWGNREISLLKDDTRESMQAEASREADIRFSTQDSWWNSLSSLFGADSPYGVDEPEDDKESPLSSEPVPAGVIEAQGMDKEFLQDRGLKDVVSVAGLANLALEAYKFAQDDKDYRDAARMTGFGVSVAGHDLDMDERTLVGGVPAFLDERIGIPGVVEAEVPMPQGVRDWSRRVFTELGMGDIYAWSLEKSGVIDKKQADALRQFYADATDNQRIDLLTEYAEQGDVQRAGKMLATMNYNQFDDPARFGLTAPKVADAKKAAEVANGNPAHFGPQFAPVLDAIYAQESDTVVLEALVRVPIGGLPSEMQAGVMPSSLDGIAKVGKERKEAKEKSGAKTTDAMERMLGSAMVKKEGAVYVEGNLGQIFRIAGASLDPVFVEPDIKVMDIMSPWGVLDPIYEATIFSGEGQMDVAKDVRIPTVRGIDFMLASDHLGPLMRDIFGIKEYESVRDPESTWWGRVLSNMYTGEQGLFTNAPRVARQAGSFSTVPFSESEEFPEAANFAETWRRGNSIVLDIALGVEIPKRMEVDLDSRLDNIITAVALAGDFAAPDPVIVGGWKGVGGALRKGSGALTMAKIAPEGMKAEAALAGAFPGAYASKKGLKDADPVTAVSNFFYAASKRAPAKGENPFDVLPVTMKRPVMDTLFAAGADGDAVVVAVERARKQAETSYVEGMAEYAKNGLKPAEEMRKSPGYQQAHNLVSEMLKDGRLKDGEGALAMGYLELLAFRSGDPLKFFDDFGAESAFASMPERARLHAEMDKVWDQIGGVEPAQREAYKLGVDAAVQHNAREAGVGVDQVYAEWATRYTDAPPDEPGALQGEGLFSRTPSAPTFYSALRKGVESFKQEVFVPDQLLARLKKTPGVKADEINWTGLERFLEGKKRVTREEVLGFLDENAVVVEEVTLGGDVWGVFDPSTGDVVKRVGSEQEAIAATEGTTLDYEQGAGPVQYGDLQIQGATNYRELLFRLPEEAAPTPELPEGWRMEREPFGHETEGDTPGIEFVIYDADLEVVGRGLTADIAVADAGLSPVGWGEVGPGPKFVSTHFGEYGENLLAHTRLNDRIGPNGEKILFIEEIQSDWAQKGREAGFNPPKLTDNELAELDSLTGRWDREGGLPPELEARRAELDARYSQSGYEPAPFVESTDRWLGLVFKRILREAAEGGYDGVAWTKGVDQVRRYEDATRKAVDEVHWRRGPRSPDGNRPVVVTAKKGGRVVHDSVVAPDKIGDLLGKEMARKINDSPDPSGVLKGDDLTIGGEGMKGFYDRIIGSWVKKYAKKWGVKPGEMEFGRPGDAEIDQILADLQYEEMSARQAGDIAAANEINARARDLAEGRTVGDLKPEFTAHYLPLTDALRKDVIEVGQPLFAKKPAGTHGQAYRQGGRYFAEIYKTGDRRTFLHEAGHVARLTMPGEAKDAMKVIFDELGAELMEVAKGDYDEAQRLLDEAKATRDSGTPYPLDGTPDEPGPTRLLEERFAEAFAAYNDMGIKPADGAVEKLFRYLKDMWDAFWMKMRGGEAPPDHLPPKVRDMFDRWASQRMDIEADAPAGMQQVGATKGADLVLDPATGKTVLRVFESGDLNSIFEIGGQHLNNIMGAKWAPTLESHFPNKQAAGQAFRVYLNGGRPPNSTVGRAFLRLKEGLQYVWGRGRGAPGVPLEVRDMWDKLLRSHELAKEQVTLGQSVVRPPDIVRLSEDMPEARVEDAVKAAGRRNEFFRVNTEKTAVRAALGIEVGQKSIEADELLARAIGYVAAEQFKKMSYGIEWKKLTTRSMVPVSREKRIRESVSRRLNMALDGDFVDKIREGINSRESLLSRAGEAVGAEKWAASNRLGGDTISLTPEQQVSFGQLVRELAMHPMGNIIPDRLLMPVEDFSGVKSVGEWEAIADADVAPRQPAADLSTITLKEWEKVLEVLHDVEAGAASSNARYMSQPGQNAFYAFVYKPLMDGIQQKTGFGQSKGAVAIRDWLEASFVYKEAGEGIANPEFVELLQTTLRELGGTTDWVRVNAKKLSRGGAEGLVEIADGLRSMLEPPVHPDLVAPTFKADGTLDKNSRIRQLAAIFREEKITAKMIATDFLDIERALTVEGKATQQELAALSFIELWTKGAVDLTDDLNKARLGDSIRIVENGLGKRVSSVELRAKKLAQAAMGARDSAVLNDMEGWEYDRIYHSFYTGNPADIRDWVAFSRGGETGRSAASPVRDALHAVRKGLEGGDTRMNPLAAQYEMIASMRAMEILDRFSARLTAYGLSTDVSALSADIGIGRGTANFNRNSFAGRVHHYIDSAVNFQSISARQKVGGKDVWHGKQAAPPQASWGPGEKPPEKAFQSKGHGRHDLHARTVAHETLAKLGYRYAKGMWGTYMLPDGSVARLPGPIVKELERAQNRAASTGSAWGTAFRQIDGVMEGKVIEKGEIGGRKISVVKRGKMTVGWTLDLAIDLFPFTLSKIQQGVTTGLFLPNPAYYTGLVLGAAFQAYQGMGLRAFTTALTEPRMTAAVVSRLWKEDGMIWTPDAPALITKDGYIYTADSLTEIARREGLKSSYIHAETTEGLLDDLKKYEPSFLNRITGGKMAYKDFDSPVKIAKWWQDNLVESATALDDYFRVGTFLEALKRGESPTAAAGLARKVGFDYAALTDFEKMTMRRTVMFYSYMRKNTDLFFDTLIRNPERIAAQLRLLNGANRAFLKEDPQFVEAEYQQARLHAFFKDAAWNWQNTSQVAWILPPIGVTDAVDLGLDIASAAEGGDLEDNEGVRGLVSRLNPQLQAPIVAVSGAEIFSGRDINRYNEVPSWFVEFDRAATGGLLVDRSLAVEYWGADSWMVEWTNLDIQVTDAKPDKAFRGEAPAFTARNGKALWIYKNLLHTPGFGRSQDQITSLDRSNSGIVEAVVDAAKWARPGHRYMEEMGYHPAPLREDWDMTARPEIVATWGMSPQEVRKATEEFSLGELAGLFGLRPKMIPTHSRAATGHLKRHSMEMREALVEEGRSEHLKDIHETVPQR